MNASFFSCVLFSTIVVENVLLDQKLFLPICCECIVVIVAMGLCSEIEIIHMHCLLIAN
jgi:hypothetical protein